MKMSPIQQWVLCPPEKFDVNMFNQLFEKNKQLQKTDLETYQEVTEQHRTDFPPTFDDTSVFASSYDNQHDLNQGFLEYQTSTALNTDGCDKNVTKTRDMTFDTADTTGSTQSGAS